MIPYHVFQHHHTLVIYCTVAYLFWWFVISPTKLTAEKQHLLLAKAQDVKMSQWLLNLDRIAGTLDRLALASQNADNEDNFEYSKEEAYEQIHV